MEGNEHEEGAQEASGSCTLKLCNHAFVESHVKTHTCYVFTLGRSTLDHQTTSSFCSQICNDQDEGTRWIIVCTYFSVNHCTLIHMRDTQNIQGLSFFL